MKDKYHESQISKREKGKWIMGMSGQMAMKEKEKERGHEVQWHWDPNGSDVDANVAGMESVMGTMVGDEVKEVPGSHMIKGLKVIVL